MIPWAGIFFFTCIPSPPDKILFILYSLRFRLKDVCAPKPPLSFCLFFFFFQLETAILSTELSGYSFPTLLFGVSSTDSQNCWAKDAFETIWSKLLPFWIRRLRFRGRKELAPSHRVNSLKTCNVTLGWVPCAFWTSWAQKPDHYLLHLLPHVWDASWEFDNCLLNWAGALDWQEVNWEGLWGSCWWGWALTGWGWMAECSKWCFYT